MKNKTLSVLYCGNSPEILETLIKSSQVTSVQVVTQKVAGTIPTRRRRLLLKLAADHHLAITVIGSTWTKRKFSQQLESIILKTNPNLVLIGEFYWIIPSNIISLYKNKIFNVHKSLLPKGRSRHPIQWTVISGEKQTGVTLHEVLEKVDGGRIIMQKKFAILPEDDGLSIKMKLDLTAVEVVKLFLLKWASGRRLKRIRQKESQATVFPPRKPEDSLIDWQLTSRQIGNLVRVSLDDYRAFTYLKGDKIVISRCVSFNEFKGSRAGIILAKTSEALVVSTADGAVLITDFETEGKTKNSIALVKMKIGDKFTSKPN